MRGRGILVSFQKIIFIITIFLFVSLILINYHFYTNQSVMKNTEIFEENMINEPKDIQQRFQYRQQQLTTKCHQLKLDGKSVKANSWEFLINHEHHLIWCNVFKAASSSWLYNFNILAGYTQEYLDKSRKTPVALARMKYPRPKIDQLLRALNISISFIIVRDPFERLVSAYRNKFINSPKNEYFRDVGQKIIQATRYRKNTNEMNSTTPGTIIDDKLFDQSLYPTFEEFIRYILCQWKLNKVLNEHWTPIATFCTPCQIHFDFIIKFETLHEDEKYLIQRAHLESKINSTTWKNRAKIIDTKSVIKHYFSKLSVDQIHQLIQMFRYDFELFGYSWKKYLLMGGQNKGSYFCRYEYLE